MDGSNKMEASDGPAARQPPRSTFLVSLFSNRLFLPAICVSLALLTLFNAATFQRETYLSHHGFSDFQDYYTVGRTVIDGHPECGYTDACLRAAQRQVFGRSASIPWAYPPQFTALMAVLTPFSNGGAFLVFMLGSFALFTVTVLLLAGRYAAFAMTLMLPALQVNIHAGQNGFLTAGILGLFAWGWIRHSDRAGIALGAMVIKPHLAVAATLLVFVRRKWRMAAWASAVVAITSIAVTVWLGLEVWPAFLTSLRGSADAVWQGHFPIDRMTSLYATAYQFGAGPAAAMSLHLAGTAATAVLLGAIALRCDNPRVIAAAMLAATLLLAPYTYDYDLPILAVALALLAPLIIEVIAGLEAACLCLLLWAASGNLWIKVAVVALSGGRIHSDQVWSLSAPLLWAAIALASLVVRRALAASPPPQRCA